MANNLFNFPDQTVPESKKTKEWHMSHVNRYIDSRSSSGFQANKDVIEKLYRSYLCLMNKDEEKLLMTPITCPEGINLGVEYQIYNLIEQKIEQFIGDYLDRPVKKKSYVMNNKAQVRKLDSKIDMMSESIFRELNKSFKAQYGVDLQTPNPEMEVPEDVEEFFSKNYRDAAEEVADDLVEKFLLVDKNIEIIPELLKDYLISERCHSKIVFEDGILKLRKGHPLDVTCDSDSSSIVQDDHEFYIETHFLTINEIYNTFILDKTQKKEIGKYFDLLTSYSNGKLSGSLKNSVIDDKGWYVEDGDTFRLATVEMIWKSRSQIRVKINEDENGVKTSTVLSEKDRFRKKDKKKIIDLEMPRHICMVGPETVLSYGVEEHRNYRISDRKKCFLDVVSLVRQGTLGVHANRSVAAKLYKMQSWASEILFELRLAMRQNNGRVMLYDVAQTPKQYLKASGGSVSPLNQVKHHMKKDKIVYINSKERNNRNTFNQFQSIDLSNSKMIQDLMEGIMMIEDMANKMIGLNAGREGSAGQYTTATNIEAQRKSSFSKTEIYYRPFDYFIRACLERMLMKAKKVYKENEFIHYVLGDLRAKFVQIMPEFKDSDIGLYFNDAGRDNQKKTIIDQAAQMTLGNAQTPEMMKSLIDVLCEDTAVESRAVLDRAVSAMTKAQEQRAQAEQEAALNNQRLEQEEKDIGHNLTKRGQDKDIAVAHIYADQKNKQIGEQEDTKKMLKLADIQSQNIEQLESKN